jgi:Toprim domain
MSDDTDDIIRRLDQDLEGVLSKYYPGWITQKVKSQDVALLTPKKVGKRITSSFTMNLSGDRRGQWYRFSAGFGGGTLALIYYAETGRVPSSKSDWAEAFRFAKDFLGIEQRQQISDEERREREQRRDREQREREERRQKAEEEKAAAEAKKTMTAVEIWNGAQPLAGSQAEAYLVGRGISPVSEWPWDPKDVLRFHPSINHEREWQSGRWPALIGLVVDAFGNPTALWQVYLDRKEAKKAPLDLPKLGRGPTNGGAIRIGGEAGRIGVAEGMETAIASWDLEMFRKPVWSLMSTSGMKGFEVPLFVDHVSIYKDGDKGQVNKHNGAIMAPPGDAAATALHDRLQATGIGSNINEMALLGDGLDLKQVLNRYERSTKKAV